MNAMHNQLKTQSIVEFEQLKGLRGPTQDSYNKHNSTQRRTQATTSLGDFQPSSPARFLNPMDEFLGRTAELDESRPFVCTNTGQLIESIGSSPTLARKSIAHNRSFVNYIPTLHAHPRMPSFYGSKPKVPSLRGSNLKDGAAQHPISNILKIDSQISEKILNPKAASGITPRVDFHGNLRFLKHSDVDFQSVPHLDGRQQRIMSSELVDNTLQNIQASFDIVNSSRQNMKYTYRSRQRKLSFNKMPPHPGDVKSIRKIDTTVPPRYAEMMDDHWNPRQIEEELQEMSGSRRTEMGSFRIFKADSTRILGQDHRNSSTKRPSVTLVSVKHIRTYKPDYEDSDHGSLNMSHQAGKPRAEQPRNDQYRAKSSMHKSLKSLKSVKY